MSYKHGSSLQFLNENREISNLRLWIIRIVVGFMVLSNLTNLVGYTTAGALGYLAGTFIVAGAIYALLLRVFSKQSQEE